VTRARNGSIQNLEDSVVIRQANLDDDVHQQHDEACEQEGECEA